MLLALTEQTLPLQGALHLGAQHRQLDRLDEVAMDAAVKGFDRAARRGVAGDDDPFHVGRTLPQSQEHLEAGHVRELEIQHGHVDGSVRAKREGLVAAVCQQGVIARIAEREGPEVSQSAVVVDDEHRRRRRAAP